MTKVIKKEISYPSADGVHTVHGYIWAPASGNPRAILQLCHGMCEYVTRYEAWAERFAAEGFVFCGNDHLGHGATAKDARDLGYTARRNGADYLVRDAYEMTTQVRALYEGVPILLYGHSMGSFVARSYLLRYQDCLSGVILSGTAGPGAPTSVAKGLSHVIETFRGAHHRSPLIYKLAFGSYGKRFRAEKDSASWISRDAAVREAYRADPLCAYRFTLAGYDTLFTLLSEVSSKKWANGVRKDLPVLLLSGDMDPVGDYGKGVLAVKARLAAAGCDVRLKLYAGGRHEMHNETNRDEVFADLVSYLEEILV